MIRRLKLVGIFCLGLPLCGVHALAETIERWADRHIDDLIARGEKIKAGK